MKYVIITLICCVVFVVSLHFFRKARKEFEKKRKEFVDFLFSVNDTYTLRKIGEINMFGKEERWYPNYRLVEKALKKRINEEPDAEVRRSYEQFYNVQKKFVKQARCTLPFMLFSAGLPLQQLIDFLQGRI